MNGWAILGDIICAAVIFVIVIVAIVFVCSVIQGLKQGYQTLVWRKDIHIGDRCYFKNANGDKTHCHVVSIVGHKILINTESPYGDGSQWVDKCVLYYESSSKRRD